MCREGIGAVQFQYFNLFPVLNSVGWLLLHCNTLCREGIRRDMASRGMATDIMSLDPATSARGSAPTSTATDGGLQEEFPIIKTEWGRVLPPQEEDLKANKELEKGKDCVLEARSDAYGLAPPRSKHYVLESQMMAPRDGRDASLEILPRHTGGEYDGGRPQNNVYVEINANTQGFPSPSPAVPLPPPPPFAGRAHSTRTPAHPVPAFSSVDSTRLMPSSQPGGGRPQGSARMESGWAYPRGQAERTPGSGGAIVVTPGQKRPYPFPKTVSGSKKVNEYQRCRGEVEEIGLENTRDLCAPPPPERKVQSEESSNPLRRHPLNAMPTLADYPAGEKVGQVAESSNSGRCDGILLGGGSVSKKRLDIYDLSSVSSGSGRDQDLLQSEIFVSRKGVAEEAEGCLWDKLPACHQIRSSKESIDDDW